MTHIRAPKLSAIGQAVVDLTVHVSHAQVEALGYKIGTYSIISAGEQEKILATLADRSSEIACGGSVINSLVCYRVLGGRAHATCRVGLDRFGENFKTHLVDNQIEQEIIIDEKSHTALSIILVSEEGERTMLTCHGAAGQLAAHELSNRGLHDSAMLFFEGYLLAIPGTTAFDFHKEVLRANVPLALGIGASWIAQKYESEVKELIQKSSILFCNEQEAAMLSGRAEPKQAAHQLGSASRIAVVTVGSKGAYLSDGTLDVYVPAVDVKVVDTTGAGDAFAGAFLRAHLMGIPLERAARGAAFIASDVVASSARTCSQSAVEHWKKIILE